MQIAGTFRDRNLVEALGKRVALPCQSKAGLTTRSGFLPPALLIFNRQIINRTEYRNRNFLVSR